MKSKKTKVAKKITLLKKKRKAEEIKIKEKDMWKKSLKQCLKQL